VTEQETPPLCVALTADVDPDANRALPGRVDAVSPTCGGRDACLEGCATGLEALLSVVGRLGIPCTFFWEARSLQVLRRTVPSLVNRILDEPAFEHGCHGLRHEDFSGRGSGIAIGEDETFRILEEATAVVTSGTGRRPVGFRAPYCRLTPALQKALGRLNYAYDASLTRTPGPEWSLRPYVLMEDATSRSLWELALCRSIDRRGRAITSYLWQLFEGRRQPQDYADLASSVARKCGGGLLQIALHPWHLVVSEDGEPLRPRLGHEPADDLLKTLSAIQSLKDVRFVTAGQYLGASARDGSRRPLDL
jgi:hypothetical protein